MNILPVHLRTPSSVSSPAVDSNHVSRLHQKHSPAATQVAQSLMRESMPHSSIHGATAFQSQIASAPQTSKLGSELELLDAAKVQTQMSLKQAQAELALMTAGSDKSAPSATEVNTCFLYSLHQEKQATHEVGGLGRVYQAVLDEEVEVQMASRVQHYLPNSHKVWNHIECLDQELNDKVSQASSEKNENIARIRNSSLNDSDKEIAENAEYKMFSELIADLQNKKDIAINKLWQEYHAETESFKPLVNNGEFDDALMSMSSPLAKKSGEVAFLKHKLAMLDYSQKTSSCWGKDPFNQVV